MNDLYHDPIFYLETHAWNTQLEDIDAFDKIKSRTIYGDPVFLVLQSWYTALGKGCEKNIYLATAILEKESIQKNAIALCAAGVGYMRGYYGEPDAEKALVYFEKAESMCIRKANYQKGLLFYHQFIKKRNDISLLIRAEDCFEKAAMNGHATSFHMLAACRTRSVLRHLFKRYFSTLVYYLVSRRSIGGPERWWCYRDLVTLNPPLVRLAENCGHALGYP